MSTNKDKGPGVYLGLCPFCGKENGEIIIDGSIKTRKDEGRFIMTMNACKECEDKMEKDYVGIIIIDPEYVKYAADGRLNPKDVKRIEGGATIRRDVVEQLVGKKIEGKMIFMDIEMFEFLFKKDKDGNVNINPDRINQTEQ